MKTPTLFLLCLLAPCIGARAATLYVDAGSTNVVAPYASLATAARDIQTAVNAAAAGDTVLVAAGVYDTGVTTVSSQKCRVYISKNITVRSLFGPERTHIQGDPATQGTSNAIRCVQMTAGALEGFTLRFGSTLSSGTAYAGGGALLSGAARLTNCVIANNSASQGAGVSGGYVDRCVVYSNEIRGGSGSGGGLLSSKVSQSLILINRTGLYGGGLASCLATNCTVRYNNAGSSGGGAYQSTLVNSIVWDNTGFGSPNTSANVAVSHSSLGESSLPSGVGNSIANPRFASIACPDPATSPCMGAGLSSAATGTDVLGRAWLAPPAMGCLQPLVTEPGTAPSVRLMVPGRVREGQPATVLALPSGPVSSITLDFGDGTFFSGPGYGSHAWRSPGIYPVVATVHANGLAAPVTATGRVEVVATSTRYVSDASGDDANDGLAWATAKKTIQAAVDAQTEAHGLVLVTNGNYRAGGRTEGIGGFVRVYASRPVRIRSVNGPEHTRIVGNPGAAGTAAGVRCVQLADSEMEGFTLDGGSYPQAQAAITAGSGAYLTSNARLVDCVVANCVSTDGGGVYGGVLERCRLLGNRATAQGGGAANAVLLSCLVDGNTAQRGGGLYSCIATNCTVRFNACSQATSAGGQERGSVVNGFLRDNQGPSGASDFALLTSLAYSRFGVGTVSGEGNAAADALISRDHHLLPGSNALGTGQALPYPLLDLDGDTFASPPSIGVDETSAVPRWEVSVLAPDQLHAFQPAKVRAWTHAGAETLFLDFGDGTPPVSAVEATHVWMEPGLYTVTATATFPGAPGPVQSIQTVRVLNNTRYVAAETGNDANDGFSWATAKKTIQAGINAAAASHALVLVSNGVYETGSTVPSGDTTPTLVVASRSMVVRSVNGYRRTRIQGLPVLGGHPSLGVRCAYLDGATLDGFTLAHGNSRGSGGGVWMSTGGLIRNCLVTDNQAAVNGGGVFGGRAENCTLAGNTAAQAGGGALGTALFSCLVVHNKAASGGGLEAGGATNCTFRFNTALTGSGGGARASDAENCILWQNTAATSGPNQDGCALRYCTLPEVATGASLLRTDPALTPNHHLPPASTSAGTGRPGSGTGTDLDGDPRPSQPSRGSDEPASPGTDPGVWLLAPSTARVHQPRLLLVETAGPVISIRWDLGDGTVVNNLTQVSHVWSAPGTYTISVTLYTAAAPQGIVSSASLVVEPNTYYVSDDTGDDSRDGLGWSTAVKTIQAAVNRAGPWGVVMVTNGVYREGGVPAVARVRTPWRMTVRSVNGPFHTTILGVEGATGTARGLACAELVDTTLDGFTLQHGTYSPASSTQGMGAYMQGDSLLRNSIVMEVVASSAVLGGRMENCVVAHNSVGSSGAVSYTAASNSLIARNVGSGLTGGSGRNVTIRQNVSSSGAADSTVLQNCIVWGNTGAGIYSNLHFATCSYTCAGGSLPAGTGNINVDPLFEGTYHLRSTSPCRGRGQSGSASGTDLDGDAWLSPPSMGCDEPFPSPGSIPALARLRVHSRVLLDKNALIMADTSRPAVSYQVDYGDGTPAESGDLLRHAWSRPGLYPVVLTAAFASPAEVVSTTQVVEVIDTTIYVDGATGDDARDGRTPATAKKTIQAGISAQTIHLASVLVADGVYDSGSMLASGSTVPCRVALDWNMRVRSVNGPARTFIRGVPNPATNSSSLRCAHLLAGGLEGFTLEQGVLNASLSNGAGALLGSSAQLLNCILRNNVSSSHGGGLSGGTAVNCLIIGNQALGQGGGAYSATLRGCAVVGNRSIAAAGMQNGSAYNCTITGNESSGTFAGGAVGATLVNCIVWGNRVGDGSIRDVQATTCSYTLTGDSLQSGTGNLTGDPLLVSTYHLSPSSPCVGVGTAATGVDIDGQAWSTPPALGCDQPAAPQEPRFTLDWQPHVSTGEPSSILLLANIPFLSLTVSTGDGALYSGREYIRHEWLEPGEFHVVASLVPADGSPTRAVTGRVTVADTRIFVSASAVDDSGDGRTWATAKRTLQAGVDAQPQPGGIVLVGDGLYEEGSRLQSSTPCRVLAVNPVRIRSLNGPEKAIIVGVTGAPGSSTLMRGAHLINSRLEGFTVASGVASSGPGVYLEGQSSIRNCRILFNRATGGGAVYGGAVFDSVLAGNRAAFGAGAYDSLLSNCLLLFNAGDTGAGGLSDGAATNCTFRFNRSVSGAGGITSSVASNCIVWENTSGGSSSNLVSTTCHNSTVGASSTTGTANLLVAPLFEGAYQLSTLSPCSGTGRFLGSPPLDLHGGVRPNPPSMGCVEPGNPGRFQLLVPPVLGTGHPQPCLALAPAGNTGGITLDFGDGSAPVDGPEAHHAWMEPGLYHVVATLGSTGQAVTQEVRVVDNRVYVSATTGDDSRDGRSWTAAKRSIQAGVNAQDMSYGLVVVGPGFYDQGLTATPATYSLPTRVVCSRSVHLHSLEGPERTFIAGLPGSYGTLVASRGVFLRDSILDGFSILDCATANAADHGAGVLTHGASVVRNCILWGNRAGSQGGGIHGGTVVNCLLVGNQASQGGATYGARVDGSAAAYNQAGSGGAFHSCSVTNATILANLATISGGGIQGGSLRNGILWDNRVNTVGTNHTATVIQYSNVGGGVPPGTSNLSAPPLVSGFHSLSPDSPSRAAGQDRAARGTDLDGDAWGSPPSQGSDEPAPGRPVRGRLLHRPETLAGVDTAFLALTDGWSSGVAIDFGDGSPPVAGPFATHAYAEAGAYQARLRFTSPDHPEEQVVTSRVVVREAALYVSARVGHDSFDGRGWSTAKRTIQAAVNEQYSPIGVVLVAEGVYNFGATTVSTLGDNQPTRVVVSRPMSVIAVDGPGATRIQGAPGAQGTASAVRGAYLKDAILEGFTIEHGAGINTLNDGGGVYMEGSARLRNCVVALNRSGDLGGGLFGGAAENCWVVGNVAAQGAGARSSRLLNCAVLYNQAATFGGGLHGGFATNCTFRLNSVSSGAGIGGGVYSSAVLNCIAWDNTSASGANYFSSSSTYSCMGGSLAVGTGNRNANPRFFSLVGLLPVSPCVGAGQPDSGAGVDVDGEAWRSIPSMGCDEPVAPGPDDPPFLRLIAPSIAEPGVTAPILFTCSHPTTSLSVDYGDGVSQASDGYATHAWNLPGVYLITVTATVAGFPTPTVIQQPVYVQDDTRFVSASTGLDTQDGRSWATAKKTLQSAVDAQLRVGGVVLATNGVYNAGSRTSGAGEPANRVMVSRDILVRSVNGPAVTVIEGAPTSATVGNGTSAIRPAYLSAGRLEGFTLRRGFTTDTTTGSQNGRGGGAWLGAAAVLDSCVVTNNTAHLAGGGVYGGTVRNCLLAGNFAPTGAGACTSVVSRCTVVANTASTAGGGVSGGVVDNSVVSGNLAPLGPDLADSTATFTCSPGLSGAGNLDATPLFVAPSAFNFRLRPDSPGLDLASPVGAPALDLDRLPRQVGPAPDLGAYEYAAAISDSDADGMADGWETTHALDLFNPADALQNPDGDAHSNLQEFIAGSLPRDASSHFLLQAEPSEPGLAPFLTVQALAGRAYTLEYRDSLSSGAWQTVPGLGMVRPAVDGPLTFSDPTPLPTPLPARLYRVRVER